MCSSKCSNSYCHLVSCSAKAPAALMQTSERQLPDTGELIKWVNSTPRCIMMMAGVVMVVVMMMVMMM